MKVAPKFSVIIPTLNERKFLPHLLDSLLYQSRQDFEVIVVDGKSRDRTTEVANLFAHRFSNLTIIKSPQSNVSLQRNLGAEKARGEWLVFLDADAILLPYALERMYEFASDGNKFFTSWFSPDGTANGDVFVSLLAMATIQGSLLMKKQVSPGGCTVIQKSVFQRVGGYDLNIGWGEDYDLTQRVAEMGTSFSICHETLYVFSLRRLRKQGKIRVFQMYAKAILSVLITSRAPKKMSGYIMGGQLYNEKKSVSRSRLKDFRLRLRELVKDLFQ